jgi:hypothetical protein
MYILTSSPQINYFWIFRVSTFSSAIHTKSKRVAIPSLFFDLYINPSNNIRALILILFDGCCKNANGTPEEHLEK